MAPTKKTKQRVEISFFKVFLYIFLIGFILMVFIGYSVSIRPQEGRGGGEGGTNQED